MYSLFKRHVAKSVDGTGLAIFRIGFSLVLWCEVLQMYYFRHLIFDNLPFLVPYELDLSYALWAWLAVIPFITLGLFTRAATVVNYAFSLVFFATISSFEYHMFYSFMGLNFLLMFLPVQNRLSLDNLRSRWSHLSNEVDPEGFRVSKFANTWPLFLGIALVYSDSIFYKLSSPIWRSGLGMWYPASLPQLTHAHIEFLLNQKWLMFPMGYLTLVFELVFIFIFWFRWARLPLYVIGIGLHVGILICFPIPWFALGVVALYSLLLPSKIWPKILAPFAKTASAGGEVTFDPQNRLHLKVRALFQHFDLFGRLAFVPQNGAADVTFAGKAAPECFSDMGRALPLGLVFSSFFQVLGSPIAESYEGWKTETDPAPPVIPVVRKPLARYAPALFVSVLFFSVLQIHSTSLSPPLMGIRKAAGLVPGTLAYDESNRLSGLSRSLFGITPHPVFMDFHYRGYNHIVAVVHVDADGHETWLPIIDESGSPDLYIYGANWVKWTFRVNSGFINQRQLVDGINRFTAFWAHEHDVSLRDARFEVRVKKIDLPTVWKKDFLSTQRAKPWQDAGEVNWKGFRPQVKLKKIEAM